MLAFKTTGGGLAVQKVFRVYTVIVLDGRAKKKVRIALQLLFNA